MQCNPVSYVWICELFLEKLLIKVGLDAKCMRFIIILRFSCLSARPSVMEGQQKRFDLETHGAVYLALD